MRSGRSSALAVVLGLVWSAACVQRHEKDEFEGIGAALAERYGVEVLHLVPGGGAEAAGLRPGDVFEEIDGIDVRGSPLLVVLYRLRGRAGTTVSVKVFRRGSGSEHELTITRGRVHP